MHGKFNIAFQLKNESTGEIIRDFKTDIDLDTLDGCSMDYIKECIEAAYNSVINVINDI